MGASCLTVIITCQIQKEYPIHTLSNFLLDSHAVRPPARHDLTKNNNFAILHTLACVYAEAGKGSQARDLLQYGELEAAARMYGRVEKPKFEYPGASYDLARQHQAALVRDRNHPKETKCSYS